MLMVGFLTHNDSDILRAKTGPYRRVGYQTNIPPTMQGCTLTQHQDHRPQQTLSLVAMTLITHPLITLTCSIQKTMQGISNLKSISKKKLQDLSSHMISQFFRIWSVMGATHLGYQRLSGNLFIGWAHLSCHVVTSISS